jgi:acetylornithine deacetylase
VIEEECTGNGALSALARGHTGDAAIIPEPFGDRALEAQVGVLWARITVTTSASCAAATGPRPCPRSAS